MPVQRAGRIWAVPTSIASWCQVDGQTIFRAIPPTYGKSLNCTYSRDARIRTGDLLLPKPTRVQLPGLQYV